MLSGKKIEEVRENCHCQDQAPGARAVLPRRDAYCGAHGATGARCDRVQGGFPRIRHP
jgi:hypothetical protein